MFQKLPGIVDRIWPNREGVLELQKISKTLNFRKEIHQRFNGPCCVSSLYHIVLFRCIDYGISCENAGSDISDDYRRWLLLSPATAFKRWEKLRKELNGPDLMGLSRISLIAVHDYYNRLTESALAQLQACLITSCNSRSYPLFLYFFQMWIFCLERSESEDERLRFPLLLYKIVFHLNVIKRDLDTYWIQRFLERFGYSYPWEVIGAEYNSQKALQVLTDSNYESPVLDDKQALINCSFEAALFVGALGSVKVLEPFISNINIWECLKITTRKGFQMVTDYLIKLSRSNQNRDQDLEYYNLLTELLDRMDFLNFGQIWRNTRFITKLILYSIEKGYFDVFGFLLLVGGRWKDVRKLSDQTMRKITKNLACAPHFTGLHRTIDFMMIEVWDLTENFPPCQIQIAINSSGSLESKNLYRRLHPLGIQPTKEERRRILEGWRRGQDSAKAFYRDVFHLSVRMGWSKKAERRLPFGKIIPKASRPKRKREKNKKSQSNKRPRN